MVTSITALVGNTAAGNSLHIDCVSFWILLVENLIQVVYKIGSELPNITHSRGRVVPGWVTVGCLPKVIFLFFPCGKSQDLVSR